MNGNTWTIPSWITDNERQQKPTEITVPVMVGIAPVWDHVRSVGGWYGRVDVAVPFASPPDEPILDCDHVHADEADAWVCAEQLARTLVDGTR